MGVNRRVALRLALGGAVALAGATVPGLAVAGSSEPPPLPGKLKPDQCFTFTVKHRRITICPGAKRPPHGVLKKAVFIDGRPMSAMVMNGKFISPLNQHVAYDSLLEMAEDMPNLLGEADLAPPRPPVTPPGHLKRPPRGRPRGRPHGRPRGRPHGRRRAGGVRRNVADLSAGERADFVDALFGLKRNGSYDYFVDVHRRAFDAPWGAHSNAAFLPWHRALLYLFEYQLQQVGVSALPYWDWSTQRAAGMAPFTSDFMGGDGYFGGDAGSAGRPRQGEVTTGPFAFGNGDWQLTVTNDSRDYLRRELGQRQSTPSGPGDVGFVMDNSDYDTSPYDGSVSTFRNLVEGWRSTDGMHNSAHRWTGGNMLATSSPNDPIFFLNHCYVDRLWADWQTRYPQVRHYEPATASATVPGLDTPLEPFLSELGWRVTPRDAVSYQNWYTYAPDQV